MAEISFNPGPAGAASPITALGRQVRLEQFHGPVQVLLFQNEQLRNDLDEWHFAHHGGAVLIADEGLDAMRFQQRLHLPHAAEIEILEDEYHYSSSVPFGRKSSAAELMQ